MQLMAQACEALGRPDLLPVGLRCKIATKTDDQAVMSALVNDTACQDYLAVNHNLSAAPDVIMALAKAKYCTTRRALASNPCIASCPSAVAILANDPDAGVRCELAANQAVASCSAYRQVLWRLFDDENLFVHETAALALRRSGGE